MKVCVAHIQKDYDDYELLGVFSSEENGRDVLGSDPNISFDEFELDKAKTVSI